MSDRLHAKRDDLEGYATKAMHQHAAGDHAEALGNMRKAAEAACKLLLYHTLNEKRATTLVEGSSLQLLIEAVQRHAGVPSEVINHLKALQIHGNKAVHDGPVARGSAAIGVVHLEELMRWIHVERMGIPLPAAWLTLIDAKDAGPSLDDELERQERERTLLRDRIAEQEARLSTLVEADARRDQERAQVEAELLAIRESAKQQEKLRDELAHLRQDVAQQSRRTPEIQAPITAPKQPQWKRQWLLALLSLGLVLAWAVYHYRPLPVPEREVQAAITPPADPVLRVVVLPFVLLQDDPNVQMRMEELLRSHLEEHAKSLGIALDLQLIEQPTTRSISESQALALADSLYAGLMIFGDLAEPTATDSGALTLRYVLRRMQDLEIDRFEVLRFRTLNDKAMHIVLATADNLMERASANVHARQGRWSSALAMLHATPATTAKVDLQMSMFRMDCHMRLGNYQAAIKESNHLFELAPDHPNLYLLTAKALRELHRYPEARAVYEEAIQRAPELPEPLLDYADLLVGGDPNDANSDKALALVRRALVLDSTSGRAWFYLAQTEYMRNQFKEAIPHYERAVRLGFAEPAAKVNLAELILYRSAEQDERALGLLEDADAAQPFNPRTLFLLGELYSKSSIYDPEKAKAFYARSMQRFPQGELENRYGLATVALQEGRPQEAVEQLASLWARDSSVTRVGRALSQAYLELRQFGKAMAVAQQLLALDPLDPEAHYIIGYLYNYGDPSVYDQRKAIEHFNLALRSSPDETLVLGHLGNIYLERQESGMAEASFRKGLSVAPRSHSMNKGMAMSLEQLDRPDEAYEYYEKALAVRPDDALVCSNLAYLCLGDGPHRDIVKALALARISMRLDPSPPNRMILALALLQNKRHSEAAQEYERAVGEDPTIRQPVVENALRNAGVL